MKFAAIVALTTATALIALPSCTNSSIGFDLESPTSADPAPDLDFGAPSDRLEPMAPSKKIRYGKSCKECDFNIENGLKCTIPAKKTCGAGDLSSGSGYCVARPTDKKGYCSGRCKSSSDCKSGYSCVDLKTGAGGVCVR